MTKPPLCERCGTQTHWKARRGKNKRYCCPKCGRYGKVKIESIQPEFSFTDNGNERVVVLETRNEINSTEDVLQELKVKINLDEWALDHFRVGVSHAWRKDRSVEWHTHDGHTEGDVHDTGGIIDHPLRTLQAWLKRRTKEIRTRLVVDDLKRDMQAFAPKYSKIQYPKLHDGLLLEVPIGYDLHFGKLVWAEESGENSDLKLQAQRARDTLCEILALAGRYPIAKILFVCGGDYYNCDGTSDSTTKGTLQSEDTRFQKTYRQGRQLAIEMIDACTPIAPVDVLVLSGNHDVFRSFAMGDALECWYRQSPNVTIDNRAAPRKYYRFGLNLVGFSHGSDEKIERLPKLMASEAREHWSSVRNCEFHSGHFHHAEAMFYFASEKEGMLVRFLRALTPPDAWHVKKGFIGAVQAAEAFLWHPQKGVIVTLSAPAEKNLE